MIQPGVILATTLAFVLVCVACDVRTLRIPNVLTGPAIIAGLLLNAWLFGWPGIRLSVGGFGTAIALLIVPFALGGIGGGDVKMMGAVGALIGPQAALQALVVGLILGGCFTAVHLARRARLREKLGATASMFANAVMLQSLAPLTAPASDPDAIALPYSLPLGLGTVSVLAMSLVSAK